MTQAYTRVDGEYLGECACGCGTPLFERLYLRDPGAVAFRTRPRFAPNHSLRVHHCVRPGAPTYPVAQARAAMLLAVGDEVHATIVRRRRELGLNIAEMKDLLGWARSSDLHRYRSKATRLMPSTLHRILDRLFADEGGWVEAAPLWRLARQRRALWGMTDNEMAAHLGTDEVRWIGRETARRILLTLSGPRRPSATESDETRRERARVDRARFRAQEAACEAEEAELSLEGAEGAR
jgi:hypothetical protein